MAEQNIKGISLGAKVMLGYFLGILILTLVFSISIVYLGSITDDYNTLVNDSWRQLDDLQCIRAAGMQTRLNVELNPTEARSSLALIDYYFSSFLGLSRGGLPLDTTILARNYYDFRRQTQALLVRETRQINTKQLKKYDRSYFLFIGKVLVEIERARTKLEVSESNFVGRINQVLLVNILLAPLNFLFLYYYAFTISNNIGLRLRRFLTELSKILAGQYSEKIKDSSEDEIGRIAGGVNELARRLGG